MTSINPHTTRANGTILTATIYNSDHVNHVTNALALNDGKIEATIPPVVDGHAIVYDGIGGNTSRSAGAAPRLIGNETFTSGTVIVSGTSATAGGVQLGEDTDNGANTWTLRAPAALAANVAMTLPPADGTYGQVLQTNGAGALGFANVGPVGSIVAWPTATPPTGWLECDGSAISRTSFATLFAVISDDYGAGDGSTTFNIPDYRGEFLRGMDPGNARDPDSASRTDRGDGTTGANVGTKQGHQFLLHGHPARYSGASSTPDGSGGIALDNGSNSDQPAFTGTLGTTLGQQISGSGGNETRPRNVNVKWIIRVS